MFKKATLVVLTFFISGCIQPGIDQTELSERINTQAIANITTYKGNSDQPLTSSRGFVVEKDGYVLTSYRTLLTKDGNSLAAKIHVALFNKTADAHSEYIANIVAVEPTLNFAILKVTPDRELPVARIVKREDIKANKAIFAFNKITQEGPNFIQGKLKHLNAKECYQESMTATMLEAKIKLPKSQFGSPVFNQHGEVIAIHTGYTPPREHKVKKSEQYILPIFLAFNIYESIKKRESYISPWTGFSVRPLTAAEQAVFPVHQQTGGIGIEYVWPNSPAEKLGIKVDDILMKFSYYPTPSPAEFQKWLYQYGVGKKVYLHVLRNKKEYLTFDYEIEERPEWAVPK